MKMTLTSMTIKLKRTMTGNDYDYAVTKMTMQWQ